MVDGWLGEWYSLVFLIPLVVFFLKRSSTGNLHLCGDFTLIIPSYWSIFFGKSNGGLLPTLRNTYFNGNPKSSSSSESWKIGWSLAFSLFLLRFRWFWMIRDLESNSMHQHDSKGRLPAVCDSWITCTWKFISYEPVIKFMASFRSSFGATKTMKYLRPVQKNHRFTLVHKNYISLYHW